MFSTKRDQIRGLWFTAVGQRCHGWVPAGQFTVVGETKIDGTLAVQIQLTTKQGPMYHISLDSLQRCCQS
jgi:hypothetical protein